MELNWTEFESWLSTSEKAMKELNDSLSSADKDTNLATELKNAQVRDSHTMMSSLCYYI